MTPTIFAFLLGIVEELGFWILEYKKAGSLFYNCIVRFWFFFCEIVGLITYDFEWLRRSFDFTDTYATLVNKAQRKPPIYVQESTI